MAKNPVASYAQTINQRKTLYNLAAFVYLASIITLAIIFGLSPWLYFLFTIFAAILIIPSYQTGFKLIIIMTMIFERFFTLQSLVMEQQIFKLYPLDIVIGLVVIGWFISFIHPQAKTEKPKIFWQTPEKILFSFIILSLLYFIWSLFNFQAQTEVAFSTFKNYAFYPLLYFLTIYSIQNKKFFKETVHLIFIGGILIIGFIVTGFVSGQGLWTQFTPLSTEGVRFLAGTHAFYLTLASVIAVSLLAFKRFWHNGFAIFIIWIWLIGIIASLMRHLWLALALGVLVLFILLPRPNKKIIGQYFLKNILIIISIAAIIILAASLYSLTNVGAAFTQTAKYVQDRAVSLVGASADTSVAWRLDLWRSAKNAWLTNPLLGVGYGQKIILNSGDWQTDVEIRNLHNSPLAILVQMGFLGLGIFAAFILAVIIKSGRHLYAQQELRPYYLGILAAIVIFLFASLFQPYLETNLMGIFLWIMLGLLRTNKIIAGKMNDKTQMTNVKSMSKPKTQIF